ncbi:hypothetical protein Tco_0300858 [Tanacetum coccineum]
MVRLYRSTALPIHRSTRGIYIPSPLSLHQSITITAASPLRRHCSTTIARLLNCFTALPPLLRRFTTTAPPSLLIIYQ